MMALAGNKTKLVCTIGPASDSPEVIAQILQAGMNVARLNFSHGEFTQHKLVIERLRAAARAVGRDIAILADLPGPKMRVGLIKPERIELKRGDNIALTAEQIIG